MKKRIRIVYMGTPQFAVEPLKAIIEQGYDVAAVVTSPDKPAGRGLHLQQSAVKQFAIAHGLPVLQPVSLKSPAFIEQLRSLRATLQVVVAFRMLPEVVWSMPESGTFNLHASLLPQYRGAAPINHVIINGESETGITTFMLKHEMDEGDILLSERHPVFPDDTAGDLHDRLMFAGARLVIKTLQGIENGTLFPVKQVCTDEVLKAAPKILKEHCIVHWNMPAERNRNLIRGLSPAPGAFTRLKSPDGNIMTLKAYGAHIVGELKPEPPGTLQTDSLKYLRISCNDAWLAIDDLQLQGKKRMRTEEFLRGFRIDNSWKTCDFTE